MSEVHFSPLNFCTGLFYLFNFANADRHNELKYYIVVTIKKHHHESSSSETTTSTILHWEWGRSYTTLEEFIPLMAHFEGK